MTCNGSPFLTQSESQAVVGKVVLEQLIGICKYVWCQHSHFEGSVGHILLGEGYTRWGIGIPVSAVTAFSVCNHVYVLTVILCVGQSAVFNSRKPLCVCNNFKMLASG